MKSGEMWLGAGALLGAALAAASLMGVAPADDALPADVVATVDGRPVLREHYERALAALAADRRGPLREEDRERALERLIDEELLVGRALELGLASRDRRVRADLAAAMLDVIRAQGGGDPPTEDELRAFFAAEAHRFRRPPRFAIEHAFFAAGDDDAAAHRRAERALASRDLAGADPFGLPVPDGILALSAISRLLGPTAARGIADLREGETGGPWRGSGGYHVVRVVAREDGELPPFDEIAGVVREERARVAAEERLRTVLAEERARAQIEVAR